MNDEMRAHVAAFEQTVRSSLALAATLGAAEWDRPTDCPGWTVKDQFAHLVSVEASLLGDPPPEVEVPEFEHVRNDFGRIMEAGVHARRPVPGPQVAAELADVLERRLAQLPGLDPDQRTMLPNGKEGTYSLFMKFRAMDCWTHEQDVRRAVGRPGNLDAPAAGCFWELLRGGLPLIVARRAGAGPGQSVVFRITGPVEHRVAVVVDGDGRGAWAGEMPDAASAELELGWEGYVRLAAGRCGPDAVKAQVKGDEELAGRVLANMALTP
ncbi:maleylpyruvate isomerase family mycothiol-dependent enzyme [Actinomadura opuntiae]|uniref:maleylpyruvate isomerase family mycothiol-dependent enzyme n=1 Tax=Actinomadura sp. OS1-43 TaxID=604315 RepID=UPI00255AC1D8|nr:maleylpyruvate isomerase family mycothiol-dependent enzyme [Actinomadura sp. OS1-43]MDL4819702.1 maleylpyruvate isomerase family mycothiol-dependent enzyme [Actinomadura sp. OS1-43]